MMNTVALEFVPPNDQDGLVRAVDEAYKLDELSKACGLNDKVRHLLFPGMVQEDSDRPVAMKPKLEPLETWNAVSPKLPQMKGICTQVTSFLDEGLLERRLEQMQKVGMDGIIFVGVPRTMREGEGRGLAPTDALSRFRDFVPNRGVILIPTREGENERFLFKCECGATLGLTQLLYSDAIVDFLKAFAKQYRYRPEILLSFGFVPKVEARVGLIRWLIQDPGNANAAHEQAFVTKLAETSFARKQQMLLDHYRRVVDGVRELGFPLSIHLEAPYGFSKPAFETFAMMLDYWYPNIES